MAQAILARRDGDTFQARQFWRKACLLLDPEGSVIRVGFENGPKGFDDIWVEYASGRGFQDQHGVPLRASISSASGMSLPTAMDLPRSPTLNLSMQMPRRSCSER